MDGSLPCCVALLFDAVLCSMRALAVQRVFSFLTARSPCRPETAEEKALRQEITNLQVRSAVLQCGGYCCGAAGQAGEAGCWLP